MNARDEPAAGDGATEHLIHRVVAGYALFAMVWVVVFGFNWPAMLKDLIFVVVTALMLYGVVRAVARRERNVFAEYRALSDKLGDPVWRKDSEFRYIDCNAQFAAALGLTREAILGRTEADLFPMTLAERWRAEDMLVVRTLQAFEKEEIWPGRQGVGWMHVKKTPVLDASGTCIGTIGIARDINARRTAELALKESEQLFRTLFEVGEDAILIGALYSDGCPGRFEEANAAALRMFGYPRERLFAMDLVALLSDADRGAFAALVDSLHSTGHASATVACIDAAGRRIPTEMTVTRFQRGGGIDDQAVMMVIRDITAREQAEAEKSRLFEQVAQMQKLEAIGQLSGGIAHDFNNILATVLGYTGLALDRVNLPADSKLREYLLAVHSAGTRGRDLIAKMLAFSRSRSPEQIAALVPVRPRQPMVDVIGLLRSTIPATIEFETTLADDVAAISVDVVEIDQMVMNLAINARDAITGNGHITVNLAATARYHDICASCLTDYFGEYVEISVGDTGEGIDAERLPQIFQPFYTTKEVGKGTGLGLALVHGIVHRAGGHIQVETAMGQGTLVRLRFPPARTPRSPAATPAALPPPVINRQDRHIMIVDDEQTLLAFWHELLEGAGYRVTSFVDSRAALTALRTDPQAYDAVISDLTMPHINGDLMAREILSIRAELPVYLCSGYVDRLNPDTVRSLGIRGYFQKPIALVEVLDALATTFATGSPRILDPSIASLTMDAQQ